MSYDPSHRMPPRQERWPHATPAGGWPSYRDPEEEQADRLDASPATAGYRRQASSQHASGGSSDRGHQSAVATAAFPLAGTGYDASGGYGPADYGPAGYGDAREGHDRTPDGNGYGGGNGHAAADNGYGGADNGYGGPLGGYDSTSNGYAGNGHSYGSASQGYDSAGYGYGRNGNGYVQASNGYAGAGNGYAGTIDGYAAAADGFDGATDGFDGAVDSYTRTDGGYGRAAVEVNGYDWDANGYDSAIDGYPGTANGYAGTIDGYAGAAGGYAGTANDFAGAQDGFAGGAYLGPGSYTEPGLADPRFSSDPMLTAPDAGVYPESWLADQERRREASQRGPMVGALMELLATGVVIGVSTLAAALLKAQTSPVSAMGAVFIDRTPAALRNVAVQHFGAHGRTVLLLGMYAAFAVVAIVIGVLARRAAALGVAGIAAFTLFAAFAVITRPASHMADVTPAIIGGIAGVAALLWLFRASAPIAPLQHARGGKRRRAR